MTTPRNSRRDPDKALERRVQSVLTTIYDPATPHTGRKHQIRRHMKHVFHPLIGDTTHGDGRHNRIFREHLHCQRLLLCAQELSFTHPDTHVQTTIRAPLDAEFQRIVDIFGNTQPH